MDFWFILRVTKLLLTFNNYPVCNFHFAIWMWSFSECIVCDSTKFHVCHLQFNLNAKVSKIQNSSQTKFQ